MGSPPGVGMSLGGDGPGRRHLDMLSGQGRDHWVQVSCRDFPGPAQSQSDSGTAVSSRCQRHPRLCCTWTWALSSHSAAILPSALCDSRGGCRDRGEVLLWFTGPPLSCFSVTSPSLALHFPHPGSPLGPRQIRIVGQLWGGGGGVPVAGGQWTSCLLPSWVGRGGPCPLGWSLVGHSTKGR